MCIPISAMQPSKTIKDFIEELKDIVANEILDGDHLVCMCRRQLLQEAFSFLKRDDAPTYVEKFLLNVNIEDNSELVNSLIEIVLVNKLIESVNIAPA